MAYLICCEYPAHPPVGWVLTARGSADTLLVLTLRFSRCSFPLGPRFGVCQRWTLLFPLQCCNRCQNGTTLDHRRLQSPCFHNTLTSKTQTLTHFYLELLYHERVCSIRKMFQFRNVKSLHHYSNTSTPVHRKHSENIANHTLPTRLPQNWFTREYNSVIIRNHSRWQIYLARFSNLLKLH